MTTAITVRKKPVVVQASQWFKNGDHPLDKCEVIRPSDGGESFLSEGNIVRYFRWPGSYDSMCGHCGFVMREHGWIEASVCKTRGGVFVCPGDWIITGTEGEIYPCHAEVFSKVYELAGDLPGVPYVEPYVPETKQPRGGDSVDTKKNA